MLSVGSRGAAFFVENQMMMDEGTALMEMLFNKDVWFHNTDCNWASMMSRKYKATDETAIIRCLKKTMTSRELGLLGDFFAGQITMDELGELYLIAYGLRWGRTMSGTSGVK